MPRVELNAPVMGDTGRFLAHIRPDAVSRKAGLHSSNAGMAPHLQNQERVAGGGSSCISGPMESRQHPPKLSVCGCALLLQFTRNAPFDCVFLPPEPFP